MTQTHPEWFTLFEEFRDQTLSRMHAAVELPSLPLQVAQIPKQALWYLCETLYLASEANREGMHASAISLTRQCVESIGVVELGVCIVPGAADQLMKWWDDELTPGKLRKWLQENAWNSYGAGIWQEPWSVFMEQFARSTQPYAHYCKKLSLWQQRLANVSRAEDGSYAAVIEIKPQAYDAQKATRITLYHAIINYVLAKIWVAANPSDAAYTNLVSSFGEALGKSRYLDGHSTDWSEQLWAMLWLDDGTLVLE